MSYKWAIGVIVAGGVSVVGGISYREFLKVKARSIETESQKPKPGKPDDSSDKSEVKKDGKLSWNSVLSQDKQTTKTQLGNTTFSAWVWTIAEKLSKKCCANDGCKDKKVGESTNWFAGALVKWSLKGGQLWIESTGNDGVSSFTTKGDTVFKNVSTNDSMEATSAWDFVKWGSNQNFQEDFKLGFESGFSDWKVGKSYAECWVNRS